MFDVPRTIARVNNPNNAWLFNEKFHVDAALNAADLMAHLIQEEMSLGDMMTLFKIRHGRYAVVEEKVPAGAKGIGIPLKDMNLAEHCVIAAIIRDGIMTLPRGQIHRPAIQENAQTTAHPRRDGDTSLRHRQRHPDTQASCLWTITPGRHPRCKPCWRFRSGRYSASRRR